MEKITKQTSAWMPRTDQVKSVDRSLVASGSGDAALEEKQGKEARRKMAQMPVQSFSELDNELFDPAERFAMDLLQEDQDGDSPDYSPSPVKRKRFNFSNLDSEDDLPEIPRFDYKSPIKDQSGQVSTMNKLTAPSTSSGGSRHTGSRGNTLGSLDRSGLRSGASSHHFPRSLQMSVPLATLSQNTLSRLVPHRSGAGQPDADRFSVEEGENIAPAVTGKSPDKTPVPLSNNTQASVMEEMMMNTINQIPKKGRGKWRTTPQDDVNLLLAIKVEQDREKKIARKIKFTALFTGLIKKNLYTPLDLDGMKDFAYREKKRVCTGIDEFRHSDRTQVPGCLFNEETAEVVLGILPQIISNEELYAGKMERIFNGAGKSKYFYHAPNVLLADTRCLVRTRGRGHRAVCNDIIELQTYQPSHTL